MPGVRQEKQVGQKNMAGYTLNKFTRRVGLLASENWIAQPAQYSGEKKFEFVGREY